MLRRTPVVFSLLALFAGSASAQEDGDPHSDITALQNITAVVKGGEVVVSR